MRLDARDGRELLALARECIDSTLRLCSRAPFPERTYPRAQQQVRSAFITLRIGEHLRGCCGSIEATRPLAEEVWHDAWASAFRDPRFPPLGLSEWPATHLHLSILENPRPIAVESEEDLIAQLRPGVDGLVLQRDGYRATFLPSVWEQLPHPREFVRNLKLKAGWSVDFWAADIRASIYGVEEFGE